jgi:putative MFS transporter
MTDLPAPAGGSASHGAPGAVTARQADPEARLDRIPFTREHGKTAAILGFGTFFDAYDSLILASALTIVVATLGHGFFGTGVLISAGFVGQAIGALLLGSISDRYGRAKVFCVALFAFSALSVLAALSWNLESLTMARLLQGIGLGAEVPIAATLFNEYVQSKSRGRTFMLYESLFGWGTVAAPAMGLLTLTLMPHDVGWRVLLATGAVPLIGAIYGWRHLPESVRWLSVKGRIAEAEAIVDRLEDSARRHGRDLPEPVPVPAQPRQATRLGELFARRYLARTLLNGSLWFTTYFAVYGYSTWLPSLYVKVGGLPVRTALYLTIIVAAAQVGVIYAMAGVVDRVGRVKILKIGYVVALFGALVGYAMVTWFGIESWAALFVAGIMLAAGSYMPAVGLYLYIPELYPTRMRGWATSAGSSLNRLASVIAPLLVGALLGADLGIGSVFLMFAGVLLLGLVALFAWGVETAQRSLEETGEPGVERASKP